MPLPKVKLWMVSCSTGCSCCNYENHDDGPFMTREEADARVVKNQAERHLASQYSKTGNYYISEVDAEDLGDDRFIIDDRVIKKTDNGCQSPY